MSKILWRFLGLDNWLRYLFRDDCSIANAIMLSSFLDKMVHIPIDEEVYEKKLHELTRQSKFQKTERQVIVNNTDMNKSF